MRRQKRKWKKKRRKKQNNKRKQRKWYHPVKGIINGVIHLVGSSARAEVEVHGRNSQVINERWEIGSRSTKNNKI
jgi:hypothetical protein